MITNEEIDAAWGNANFGPNPDKRMIIAKALGDIAQGYGVGRTIHCICKEMALISTREYKTHYLSEKGLQFLLSTYAFRGKLTNG